MDFGLALPQGAHNDLRRDVTTVARQAEQAGFDSLWAYERVLFPVNPKQGLYGVEGLPWFPYYQDCADPLTVLTLSGAVTETIRLGTCVLIAPLHNKLLLARAVATLDQATGGGRVTLGLGGGWSTEEFAAAGADYGRRGKTFDEMLDALRALLGPNPVSYRDSQIVVDNALVNPKPAGDVPLVIGGGSPRAMRRIVEKGDGWMPVGVPPKVVADIWREILERAEIAGRDPGALRLVPLAGAVVVTDKPLGADRELFQGSPEQIMEDCAAYAGAGAHELIIGLDATVANAGEMMDKAMVLREAAMAAGLWKS
jgi:probable F420-dependent oxidoreductase